MLENCHYYLNKCLIKNNYKELKYLVQFHIVQSIYLMTTGQPSQTCNSIFSYSVQNAAVLCDELCNNFRVPFSYGALHMRTLQNVCSLVLHSRSWKGFNLKENKLSESRSHSLSNPCPPNMHSFYMFLDALLVQDPKI